MTTPPTLPRLLAANGRTLADHHKRFGPLPAIDGAGLIAAVEAAGLTGRGGAGFPTALKMAAVTGPKPVVVGNAAEGEPLSRKDAMLLKRAPHLVLDGLEAAATAVDADKVYLYLHPDAVPSATKALDERRAAGQDPHQITLVEAPDKFVAGEETAAIQRIEGGPALPRDRVVIAAVSGVRGTAHSGQQHRNPGPHRVDRPLRRPTGSGRSATPTTRAPCSSRSRVRSTTTAWWRCRPARC